MAEVALALVILVTAGLLIRSFVTLVRVDPGFARSNVAVLQVFAYSGRYPTNAHRVAFFDETLASMRAVPGVEKAGPLRKLPYGSMTYVVRTAGDAALAFVLATIGIYGIVSFATAQRTREIGVRVVVGGSARDIQALVFSEGALRVGIGVLVGLAGSLAATRLVGALLYEVSPTDPLTLGGTAALLALVALLAVYWPARRATRVDPLVALRTD